MIASQRDRLRAPLLAAVAIFLALQFALVPTITGATGSPPPRWLLYSYNQNATALIPCAA
jgi:hypothetical protein